MCSENSHGCSQNAENDFGFDCDLLERYHKDSDEYSNHNVVVTGEETWVLFENVETKEQLAVKAVDADTHSPNKQKLLYKHCLPARKLMATLFWDSDNGGIYQQGTTTTPEAYCEH
jgi:ornithine carbamoyltransferase